MSMLDFALQYAERLNWYVFPLKPGDKTPLTLHGLHNATRDPMVIRRWWTWRPKANIGLNCGKSGLVVLDIDRKHGVDGYQNFEELCRLYPDVGVGTLTSETGSGSQHRFFTAPPEIEVRNSVSKLRPGLDIRGVGGHIVLPPSVHLNGKPYQWQGNGPFDGAQLAVFPSVLIDLLNQTPSRTLPVEPLVQEHTAGNPSARYARIALDNELRRVRGAAEGTRNDTLNRAAYALGQLVGAGVLLRTVVETELFDAAVYVGLAERETQITIHSGMEAGMGNSRPLPSMHDKRMAVIRSAWSRLQGDKHE